MGVAILYENKRFEWREYFKSYKSNSNVCHMLTCGNNDLISKKFSDAFTYYATFENQVWNSVYSYDINFAHFVCLNSNTDSTYVNNVGSIGGYATTDEFLQAQCEWLDNHLTEVKARTTPPKWIIIHMHLSPFTVGRAIRLQRFVAVFEKHKVPLVLCGHNHAYSRSIPIYSGYDFNKSPSYNDYVTKINAESPELKIVDEFKGDGKTEINRQADIHNGTYYVMCQATGYKLSGKEKPILLPDIYAGTKHSNYQNHPWWNASDDVPPHPTYFKMIISEEQIDIKMYYIQNIMVPDDFGNVEVKEYDENLQTRWKFDDLVINHSDRS